MSRCVFRGYTLLGILNTVLACLFNRLLWKHLDTETGKTVGWHWSRARK